VKELLQKKLEALRLQREQHARNLAESQRQVTMHDGAIAVCEQLMAEMEAAPEPEAPER
jgi:hypothetical protein